MVENIRIASEINPNDTERCGPECSCEPDCSCKTSDFGCESHDMNNFADKDFENVPLSVLVQTSSRPEIMRAIRHLYHSDNIETILKHASMNDLKDILIERSSKLSLADILSVAKPEDFAEWLVQLGVIDEDGNLTDEYRSDLNEADELFFSIDDEDAPKSSGCPIVKHKCSIVKVALCAVLFFGIKKIIRK